MKRISKLSLQAICAASLMATSLYAAVPQGMNYQAVVRNSDGKIEAEKKSTLKFEILKGSSKGSVVYAETHSLTSSKQGLIQCVIGKGTTTDDFSKIDWSTGAYYVKITWAGKVMGTSELKSVPFAFHAQTADKALAVEYKNVLNKPAWSDSIAASLQTVTAYTKAEVDQLKFSGKYEDLTGAPDLADTANYLKAETDPVFDASVAKGITAEDVERWNTNSGDYNGLTNKPVTITPEQSAKIDSISVTSAVDLDQMKADVEANNAKGSFPGFGTTAGKVLEGNHVENWTKFGDTLYTNSKVGVNVAPGFDFGGAAMAVGGGLTLTGAPAQPTPGLFFYNPNLNDGSFVYFDKNGVERDLNGLSYPPQNVMSSDLIAKGSMSVGYDAVNGEIFGFNTIVLKENNLRILFDDQDGENTGNPNNDWMLIANDSHNGGDNFFGISDVTGNTIPFKVMAGAEDDALHIGSNGNVGIGQKSDENKLSVNGSIKATAFIGDGSGLTGIVTGTGGVENVDDALIAADTNADNLGTISLQTQNQTRLMIANDGKVGIGTSAPTVQLEVAGSVKSDILEVTGSVALGTLTYPNTDISAPVDSSYLDVTNKSLISLTSGKDTVYIRGIEGGVVGQELTIINANPNDPSKCFPADPANPETFDECVVTFVNNAGEKQKLQLPTYQVDDPENAGQKIDESNLFIKASGTIKLIYSGTAWFLLSKSM